MQYCEYCNYTTKDKWNFIKHKKTKKHLRNLATFQSRTFSTNNPPIIEQNFKKKIDTYNKHESVNGKHTREPYTIAHICPYCGTRYSRSDSLKRHEARCVVKKLQDKDNENEMLKRLLEEKDKIVKEKDKMVKEKDKTIEETTKQKEEYRNYYKQLLEISNNKLNTDNISAFNYIICHYNEADPLKEITYKDYKKARDMKYLRSMPHDEQILEDIFIAYKHKHLHKTLGDIIIKLYCTDDPKKQSLWSTDGSRNKYVVRKQNDKLCQWIADTKGFYTMDKVVKPLMDHIKDMIEQWVNKHCRENEEDIYLEFECSSDEDYISSESEENPFAKDLKREKYETKVTECVGILTDLKKDIEKKWIQRKTLKYISPYFSIDKTSIKDKKRRSNVRKR